MERPVELHTNRSAPSPMVSTVEAMQSRGCVPNADCAIACKALQSFLNSKITSSAPDLLTRKFQAIASCKGPKPKSFGRVACDANLKK